MFVRGFVLVGVVGLAFLVGWAEGEHLWRSFA